MNPKIKKKTNLLVFFVLWIIKQNQNKQAVQKKKELQA